MKSALLLALIVVVAVPSRAIMCKHNEDCKTPACCVELNDSGTFGMCKPLRNEGEKCELRPLKPRNKDMFFMMCPCAEGLTCEEDDSGDTLRGSCVQM